MFRIYEDEYNYNLGGNRLNETYSSRESCEKIFINQLNMYILQRFVNFSKQITSKHN